MDWDSLIKGFINYLMLERGMSKNTLLAYEKDIRQVGLFMKDQNPPIKPLNTNQNNLLDFIYALNDIGISERTQARMLSSIKAFFKYLLLEKLIDVNPGQLIESPKLPGKQFCRKVFVDFFDTFPSSQFFNLEQDDLS